MARPLVESQKQIYLVLLVALLMGGIFGFIFGLMDVPDQSTYGYVIMFEFRGANSVSREVST